MTLQGKGTVKVRVFLRRPTTNARTTCVTSLSGVSSFDRVFYKSRFLMDGKESILRLVYIIVA